MSFLIDRVGGAYIKCCFICIPEFNSLIIVNQELELNWKEEKSTRNLIAISVLAWHSQHIIPVHFVMAP